MQRFANESIEETPVSVSSTAAQLVASNYLVSGVVVVGVLGLSSLAIFGALLISPGCGQPT
jgi:hypothetical protein